MKIIKSHVIWEQLKDVYSLAEREVKKDKKDPNLEMIEKKLYSLLVDLNKSWDWEYQEDEE